VFSYLSVGMGSPPRVRGAVIERDIRNRFRRITPACAGSRKESSLAEKRTEDHPRVCGEQSDVSWGQRATSGSPPRVRGADCLYKVALRLVGITPACAGSSNVKLLALALSRDHPRVCGEQAIPYQNV